MNVKQVVYRSMLQLILVLGAFSLSIPIAQAKTVQNRGSTGGIYGGTSAGVAQGGYIDTCLIVGRSGEPIHATSFYTYIYCIDVEDPKRMVYMFKDGNFNTKEAAIAAMRKSKYKNGDIWTIYFPNELQAVEGNSVAELDKPRGSFAPDQIKSSTYLSTLKQYEAKLGTKLTKPVTLSDVMAGNLGKTEQQIIEESANPPKATYQITKDWYFKRWIHTYLSNYSSKKYTCNIDVFFNEQRKMASWRSDCSNEQMKLPQKAIALDTPFQMAPPLPQEVRQKYNDGDFSKIK